MLGNDVATEIVVFKPNSRSKDATIRSLIPQQTVDRMRELFGTEAADKAEVAIKNMRKNDIEFLQFRQGDRRIRIKQDA